MSYLTLYDSSNNRFQFIIGNVTPGGAYPYNIRNLWSTSTGGSMPSGTVNGVTVPTVSHAVNWSPWNANPPVLSNAGTDLNSLSIGASTSKTYYTKPNQSGSSFTFTTDSNGKIENISVSSGSYSFSYNRSAPASTANDHIYFVFVNNIGLSQYDNLGLYFICDNAWNEHVEGLHFGGNCHLNSVFTNSTANSIQERFNSGSLISAAPGSKGFRPLADITKNTIGGGNESGYLPGYTTDTLTLPGAPDETSASAVSSGMINVYKLTEANLNALGRALFGTEGINGLVTKLQNSFLNPLDAIISLQIFPCSPDVGASEHIKLFDWSSYVDKLGENSSGAKLTNQYKTFNFGQLSVIEMWESYLDYDSTAIELYLPFIGSVDIPIAEVMNGYIEVEYTIDFLTGMCVANVLCAKNVNFSSERTVPQYALHSFMGNCAVQIPLNNVSYGNIIGSLMQAAASGLRSANPGAALISLAESGYSGGMAPTVKTKGTINSNAGFCSCLYPYISITRPITAEPESFQEVMGYPSYIESKLSAYEGLCICDSIELSGVSGATESEINRIKQLCGEGVYI